jgi:hypothetical protein
MEASFSEDEWEAVEKWREKHGYSRYRLVKEAVLEKIRTSNEGETPALEKFEVTP